MTKSLRLQGYRAFEHFEMDDLARVNLLVGKNGCGKTSILEAIQILETNGSINVLTDLAYKRGEIVVKENLARERDILLPSIAHFFHGRELFSGASFAISGDKSCRPILAKIHYVTAVDGQQRSFEKYEDDFPHCTFEINDVAIAVSEEGGLPSGRAFAPQRHRDSNGWTAPVQFVHADSLRIDLMGKIWNQVILDSQESEVVDAMRILDPAFENVFFLNDYPAFSMTILLEGVRVQFYCLLMIREGVSRLEAPAKA